MSVGANEGSPLVYVMNVFSACVLHLIIEASQMDSGILDVWLRNNISLALVPATDILLLFIYKYSDHGTI